MDNLMGALPQHGWTKRSELRMKEEPAGEAELRTLDEGELVLVGGGEDIPSWP